MRKKSLLSALVFIIAVVTAACGNGANHVGKGIEAMEITLDKLTKQVNAGDASGLKISAQALEEDWAKFEDEIKDKSKEVYEQVEAPLHLIEASGDSDQVDLVVVKKAIADLRTALEAAKK